MTASLDDARLVLDAGSKLLADAVGAAKALTENGKKIDDYQVLTERVAYAATEAVAANETMKEAEAWSADGNLTPMREKVMIAAVGELITNLRDRLSLAVDDLGIGDAAVWGAPPLTDLKSWVCMLKKNLTRARGGEGSGRLLGGSDV